MARTAFRFPAAAFFFAVATTLLFAAAPSHAQDKDKGSLRDFLFGDKPAESQRRTPPPPAARFVTETGEGFILDRSQPKPLFRFENSYEVWALQPEVGPRGDIIYKNDLGQLILRATKLGGFTLYTRKKRDGVAAEVAGAVQPLKLKPVSPLALYELMRIASTRASRAAGRTIPFEADGSIASSSLIADAAIISSEVVVRMARSPSGQTQLAKIRKVVIVEGARPAVVLKNGVLLVVVAPAQGVAGRPSSDRILSVAFTK